MIPLSKLFDLALFQTSATPSASRTVSVARTGAWGRGDQFAGAQLQQETINEASKIIGDFLKDADDPFLARRKAFQFILSDPNLRPGDPCRWSRPARAADGHGGEPQEACWPGLRGRPLRRRGEPRSCRRGDSQERPDLWQNLKFDIDAALANYSRDGALMLNILNAFRTPYAGRVRPPHGAGCQEEPDQTTTAETGRTADQMFDELKRLREIMRNEKGRAGQRLSQTP